MNERTQVSLPRSEAGHCSFVGISARSLSVESDSSSTAFSQPATWGDTMIALMDKRVLIMGATQGIGLATAQRFAFEGAKVVMIDVVADETLLRV